MKQRRGSHRRLVNGLVLILIIKDVSRLNFRRRRRRFRRRHYGRNAPLMKRIRISRQSVIDVRAARSRVDATRNGTLLLVLRRRRRSGQIMRRALMRLLSNRRRRKAVSVQFWRRFVYGRHSGVHGRERPNAGNVQFGATFFSRRRFVAWIGQMKSELTPKLPRVPLQRPPRILCKVDGVFRQLVIVQNDDDGVGKHQVPYVIPLGRGEKVLRVNDDVSFRSRQGRLERFGRVNSG